MSVQRQPFSSAAPSAASPAENDLEITAELPVLDVAAYEAAAEGRTGNTDTWIIPASALPDAVAEAAASAAPAMSDEEKRTQLEVSLHALSDNLPCGFASYIDILWRERSVYTSFPQSEQILRRLTRLAAPLNFPTAMLETILRPSLVDLESAQEGYAVSLYVKALGHDAQSARKEWAAAMDAVVALIRSKEFAR